VVIERSVSSPDMEAARLKARASASDEQRETFHGFPP